MENFNIQGIPEFDDINLQNMLQIKKICHLRKILKVKKLKKHNQNKSNRP